MAITGAACGGSSSSSGASTSKNAAATGTINVWIRGAGDSAKAYQKIFDAFTAQTGIKVSIGKTTLTDFETALSAAASAHQLPDMVLDDAAQMGGFASQGIILPVDKGTFTGANQLTDQAWASATDLKGQVYAVPFSAQANVLLIRKDWLDKLGLQPPKTWADLAKVAQAFTTQDPDGNGKNDTYGLAVPGSTSRGYTSWFWSSFLYSAGGDYLKADGGKFIATLNTPQAVSSVQFLEDQVCKNKDVQPSALGDDTTATNKAFETGVAGMYLTGPYAYATMDATAVKGKYIVVAPPTGPDGTAGTLAEGTDIYTMADSKQDEVTKLEEFMVTPDAQKIGMTAVPSATVVRLPVNKTVDASAVHGDDPRWQLAQQVYASSGHYEYDNAPNWTQLRQKMSDDLNKLLSSCGDVQPALNSMNSDVTSILKQQGVG
ncbi:sugar ABC transporter substrate-binding protein [Catenulispora sp. NF23]|uniref:Sugar ABC transporter substrate-binding protein n=1 Tax=Catenulispora pinistramenti TaxID=2705254 RepID=A0ABS5L4H5_9ACTN|nr:sugar ABC transporter substrate-binding protein [Catenulispora pinistramenti]MBS2536981.1 sugar ABC transporter substrate-binding protein [Catenulispora pinistramenti]MBS2553256.1 sugar ABC transporter substrate-binding protein [Catenulispora pinistramenti]